MQKKQKEKEKETSIMGMSASQARYLNLIARQNNLEYQGQQINQERTILSQQCTALYNSLLNMQVPTPPSTSDFTTIEYAGTDGSSKFTLGSIRPNGSHHSVEIKRVSTDASLAVKYGTAVVATATDKIKGDLIAGDDIAAANVKPDQFAYVNDTTTTPVKDEYFMQYAGTTKPADTTDCYVLKNGIFKPLEDNYKEGDAIYKRVKCEDPKDFHKEDDGDTKRDYCTTPVNNYISSNSISEYYILEGNGKARKATAKDFTSSKNGYQLKTDGTQYIHLSANGTDYDNADAGKTTIAGQIAMKWDDAKLIYPGLGWEGYETAIRNKFQGDDSVDKNDFLVYVTSTESGILEPHFAFETDVTSMDGRATVYDYTPNGQYVESKVKDNCNLTFDSSGRITAIDIPITDEATGEIVAYNTIALDAVTKTDEAAYKDAYAQYEYAQYEYDKKNQEINAKTEIIQQEDRNLELKLQRLDNERTQIKTEIDALDKVIDDNIEKSYKTFSG